MKKMGEKAFKGFSQNGGFPNQQTQQRSENNIDKNSKNNKKEKKPVGEYIDYEEID